MQLRAAQITENKRKSFSVSDENVSTAEARLLTQEVVEFRTDNSTLANGRILQDLE